jgi:hypothetical protein
MDNIKQVTKKKENISHKGTKAPGITKEKSFIKNLSVFVSWWLKIRR